MLAQFDDSDNMTDVSGALSCIIGSNSYKKQQCINSFYQKWKNDSLVVNQWFSLQAANAEYSSIETINTLCNHPDFDIKNPNKVRSVVSVFAGQNLLNFHKLDGSGYEFLAEKVIELNELNPQVASRLLGPLTKWKKFDATRQKLMINQLERIMDTPKLSKDVFEVVSKSIQG
jgi:aminopeptidase N